MTGRASAGAGRNVAQEALRGDLGPYARNRVREILHGHRGLLDSIEPEDETLPCGEVASATRARLRGFPNDKGLNT